MVYSALSYSVEQTRYEHERITAIAKVLFLQRGLEAVTLADIALSLRMPLGAIERNFPAGKPALVQAVLARHLQYIHQNLAQQQLDSTSAVEELLAMRRLLQQKLSDTGVLVFHELEVYYPASWRYFRYVQTKFMLPYLRANLQRGMREGLYRPDLDPEVLIRQWVRQVSALLANADTPAELAAARYTHLSQFLENISTPVGVYAARRLQEAPPYY